MSSAKKTEPAIRLGEWFGVKHRLHLQLPCGIGLVVWREVAHVGNWLYLSTGAGVLDKSTHDSGTVDLERAKRLALRGVVLNLHLAADEATAVLVATGTGMGEA